MKEERSKRQISLPSVTLTGFRVALIYRLLPEDSTTPKSSEARLSDWRNTLGKYGAERVELIVDRSAFSTLLAEKLLRDR